MPAAKPYPSSFRLLQTVQSSDDGAPTVVFFLNYKTHIIIDENGEPSLDILRQKIKDLGLFDTEHSFDIEYFDDGADWVLLSVNEELQEALFEDGEGSLTIRAIPRRQKESQPPTEARVRVQLVGQEIGRAVPLQDLFEDGDISFQRLQNAASVAFSLPIYAMRFFFTHPDNTKIAIASNADLSYALGECAGGPLFVESVLPSMIHIRLPKDKDENEFLTIRPQRLLDKSGKASLSTLESLLSAATNLPKTHLSFYYENGDSIKSLITNNEDLCDAFVMYKGPNLTLNAKLKEGACIELDVVSSTLVGKIFKTGMHLEQMNIWNWIVSTDYVYWNLHDVAAGCYHVFATVASQSHACLRVGVLCTKSPDNAGKIGTCNKSFRVVAAKSTGSYSTYCKYPLGTFNISGESNEHFFIIPKKEGWHQINLLGLTLEYFTSNM
ncbi:hypothetical protein ACA910_015728 [Epithemia clementina (nom. ined.)]